MINNEKALEIAASIRAYLKKEYEAYVDMCGQDDDVCTLPCKKALDKAKALEEMLFMDKIEQLEKRVAEIEKVQLSVSQIAEELKHMLQAK